MVLARLPLQMHPPWIALLRLKLIMFLSVSVTFYFPPRASGEDKDFNAEVPGPDSAGPYFLSLLET